MTHLFRRAIFSVVLLASALLAHAGVSYDESPVFAFDTRDYTTGLAAESATFAFDTRVVDGNMGSNVSNLFPFDTRISGLSTVTIAGTPQITPGQSAQFHAYATYNDTQQVDVTTAAQWSIVGTPQPDTAIAGGLLQVGASVTGGTVTVAASYQTPSGQRAGAMAVTISTGFAVSAIHTLQSQGGNSFLVKLSATPSGGSPNYSYAWDTNGDGIYGDLTGQNPQWPLTSSGGTYRAKVRATDSQGRTTYATRIFSIDKQAVANQPLKLAPASYLGKGVFLDKDGHDFQFDTNKVQNGLIVLTHGWKSSGNAQWVRDMVAAIEAKIPEAKRPNILIYNWEDDADPAKIDTNLLTLARIELAQQRLGVALPAFSSLLSKALTTASVTAFLEGVIAVRFTGQSNGIALGNMLLTEESASPPRVDFGKPVHFIGHSAGGFVVGEAAWVLRQKSRIVDRVSMLDTPFPWKSHVEELPGPTVVEQYVSSIFGALEFYGTRKLPETNYHWRLSVLDSIWDYAKAFTIWGHERGHEWYEQTIPPDPDYNYLGFYFSPFANGPLAPGKSSVPFVFSGKSHSALAAAGSAASAGPFLSGFSTFGQVSEVGGVYTITEQADAGIFKAVTIPHGVESLRFKFRFSGTTDGDVIGVRFGTRPEIYTAPAGPVTRGDFLQAVVEMGAYAGMTDEVVFTLVSRGNPGAVLEIKDIGITESDDPDGDGLTVAQELAAGSSSQSADTDGDGISDYDEVNIHHTNPALADSDGDGKSDASEIAAGTNPMDNKSVFAVTEFYRAGGGFLLRWTAVAGKTYRIIRSTTADFASFDVIASGLAGVAPTRTYTDTTINTVTTPAAFYRIEVE